MVHGAPVRKAPGTAQSCGCGKICRKPQVYAGTGNRIATGDLDGWLRLANGTNVPDEKLPDPDLPSAPFPGLPDRDDFDTDTLDIRWQFLRVPLTERDYSLTERPGFLRLFGGDGLGSRFRQSLIAQRVTEMRAEIETVVEFEPEYFKQMAGLILYYDYDNYLYFHITRDEELGRVVTLLKAENKHYTSPWGYIPVPENCPIGLKMDLQDGNAAFSWSEGNVWHVLPGTTDASFLSDEACREGWFTGTMAGLCCQDLTGGRLPADFDRFDAVYGKVSRGPFSVKEGYFPGKADQEEEP